VSRIRTLDVQHGSEDIAGILKEIHQAFGYVPNLFSTYAHHPPLLEANWNKVKRVMMEGILARKTKEAIALLVSQDNGCNYCVAAHTGALKMIGVADEEIERISSQLDAADFTPAERALVRFARKANSDPHRVSDEEFAALKVTGVTDAEIIEALGVMEVFTAFNKFLDVLQVEPG
jgi:uncharacterized peroxidase-related enzyme